MFELYLDSADVEQIARFQACLPIRGVTTNPSILAGSGLGVNRLLAELNGLLGAGARYHVQVVSGSVDAMVEEARQLHALPYDIVVKIPATEKGLTAIRRLKADNIPMLATAIYSVQQGFAAALCGADYLAPYVNRIDSLGENGIGVVADLQRLLESQRLPSVVLPASFKNIGQVNGVLKSGVGAMTLPIDMAAQLFLHPAAEAAVRRFGEEWEARFGACLSFES